MAKRAHAYPQVEPGAGAVADVAIARVAGRARVAGALALARRRQAGLIVAGEGVFVLRDDLARASLLGLDRLPVRELARPLPLADVRAPEIAVRRQLASGAPMVVVTERGRPTGGAAPAAAGTAGPSLGPRSVRDLPEAIRGLIATIARVAGERGTHAFIVGGLVRDLLGGEVPAPRDLDVVVEADAIGVARALAAALGLGDGAVTEHERFLTASVDVPAAGRVDVATARSERYETPGALPRVMPAPIREDLGRRDFTVNALALELGTGDLTLIDRFGGRADLAARRLRVLHPLSFVEDPTRIFRAARYAARLGFTPDAWTARAMGLALRLAPYPALSGSRLLAELELIVSDVRPAAALRRLGRAGAFRLLDPRYRFTAGTARAMGRLPAALGWAAAQRLRMAPVELAVVALLAGQDATVRQAAARRLQLTGEPLARIERALAGAPGGLTGGPTARARTLRQRSELELAWWWLAGGRARSVVEWYVTQARPIRPALRGDDIVALGVPPGPAVGRLLDDLRDARLEGRIRDRDGEVAHVRHWIELGKEG